MFPRMTSPVARFMIGWRVPRVKIILVNLATNPNSRTDVVDTCHSFLVTMSSLLVTIITFGYYIRLLLYVPSPAPERTLSSGRPGCARGCFMRAGRPGPASNIYLVSVRSAHCRGHVLRLYHLSVSLIVHVYINSFINLHLSANIRVMQSTTYCHTYLSNLVPSPISSQIEPPLCPL